MFGYNEGNYTVEREAVIERPKGALRVELRMTVEPEQSEKEKAMWAAIIARTPENMRQPERDKRISRYIAIEGQKCDILLRYQTHQAADLESDWTELLNRMNMVSQPLTLDDMLYFEVIRGHGTGTTKDGGTIMY